VEKLVAYADSKRLQFVSGNARQRARLNFGSRGLAESIALIA